MVKLATKLDPARAQLQLKVTLRDIRPAIWRRLIVPANIKLPVFHAVLQHAFDWTDSHLHAFRIGDDSYEAYDPELWDDWPGGPEKHDESKFRLNDLLHAKGDRLRYLYDFGDSWEHDVRVEKGAARGSTCLHKLSGRRASGSSGRLRRRARLLQSRGSVGQPRSS